MFTAWFFGVICGVIVGIWLSAININKKTNTQPTKDINALPLGVYVNNINPYDQTKIKIINSSMGFSEYYFIIDGKQSYHKYSSSNNYLTLVYKQAEA